MKTFKKATFSHENRAGSSDEFTTIIYITSSGKFFAHVPDKFRIAVGDGQIDFDIRKREGFFVLSASTFRELEREIEKAHSDFLKPTVTRENVIRYNIESHVSFWVNKDGTIAPNGHAGDDGGGWASDESFGGHGACDIPEGGYSLTIGAQAVTKKTTSYGKESSVEYDRYYKGGSHLEGDNPAELLNSWCSFSLPDDAREMPYSDEAALFFHGLMQSMAELNCRLQKFTNTPKKIEDTIRNASGRFLLSGPTTEKP